MRRRRKPATFSTCMRGVTASVLGRCLRPEGTRPYIQQMPRTWQMTQVGKRKIELSNLEKGAVPRGRCTQGRVPGDGTSGDPLRAPMCPTNQNWTSPTDPTRLVQRSGSPLPVGRRCIPARRPPYGNGLSPRCTSGHGTIDDSTSSRFEVSSKARCSRIRPARTASPSRPMRRRSTWRTRTPRTWSGWHTTSMRAAHRMHGSSTT